MELAVILALRGPVKFSEEHPTKYETMGYNLDNKQKMKFRKIVVFIYLI